MHNKNPFLAKVVHKVVKGYDWCLCVITNVQLRKSICHVQYEKLGKNKIREMPTGKRKAAETKALGKAS